MEFKRVDLSSSSQPSPELINERLEQAADAALQQIIDKSYGRELDERGVSQHLYLGLAFAKQQVNVIGEWH